MPIERCICGVPVASYGDAVPHVCRTTVAPPRFVADEPAGRTPIVIGPGGLIFDSGSLCGLESAQRVADALNDIDAGADLTWSVPTVDKLSVRETRAVMKYLINNIRSKGGM